MRWYLAPGPVFSASVIFNLALASVVVWFATAQPWLGVHLTVRDGAVLIEHVAGNAVAPRDLAGSRLIGLAQEGQPALTLQPFDLIEEPDMLGSLETLKAFHDRQTLLFDALTGGAVTLMLDERDEGVVLDPAERRPLADLSPEFWAQLFVALTGLTIGAWVVCLRPRDPAAWMVLVAGAGLALASGSAAIYGTRELALPRSSYQILSRLNAAGSLIFGIGMVTLFVIYPRRIVPRRMIPVPALVLGGWIAVISVVDWPRFMLTLQEAIAATMLVLMLAIATQVALNRHDPTARAMLGWLGLSVIIGAGGFVLTTILPILLGLEDPWLRQSTAFLLFLVIHGGIAMAVTRYRLFDLSSWSLKILSYGIGVALLLLLDAALIYGLSLDRAPALGIALAVVGGLYLPLRDRLARRMRRRREMPVEKLYERVTAIAHGDGREARDRLLRAFWGDLFHPLAITAQDGPAETRLLDNGRSLLVAPVAGLPAMRLDLADGGTRLFSSYDLTRAIAVHALIARSLRQHQTYLEAVAIERSRINRDMHDNIGVLLLSALHSTATERKDMLIRQTLGDLREIISNPEQHDWRLARLAADLRSEIVDHLETAGIAVTWTAEDVPDVVIAPQVVHTLRAFLREGTSNAVRHSAATRVAVRLHAENGRLSLSMSDNGRGFDATQACRGNGFRNLAARVSQSGGQFDLASGTDGTSLTALLPLAPPHREIRP